MGNILNPDNWNSFAEIALQKDSEIFVDKTDFIGKTIELINSPAKFIAMTRPCRFGKTVTAQMLAAFYSCGCDSRELFKGLKITEYKPKNRQLQNTAEVFKTDSADFHGRCDDLMCSETKTVAEEKIESENNSGRKAQTGDRSSNNTDRSMENPVAGNTCGEADAKEESFYEKYLNKSNVIYWDMNAVQAEFGNILKKIKTGTWISLIF